METTYTQVIDENGVIQYVPTTPPTTEMGGDKPAKSQPRDDRDESILRELKQAQLAVDDKLTEVLTNLTENSKRLRYNRRLQTGKLDGRRLSAYRTSDKLFKQKAIKDKNYQFTFLIDTSGSMLSGQKVPNQKESVTRIQTSLEAVARTVKSLEDIKIRSSIFGMNNSFRLFKGFDKPLDDDELIDQTYQALTDSYEDGGDGEEIDCAGGTSEWVAYEQAVKYLDENSPPKVTNVVIIISDGEPGGVGEFTQVIINGEEEFVERENGKDRNSTLAQFWASRPKILAFGLGIGRRATQVPTNREINNINRLPEVMGNLLTELML